MKIGFVPVCALCRYGECEIVCLTLSLYLLYIDATRRYIEGLEKGGKNGSE